ncbi:E3 ubiquitin/ISG15 ligase TRIM25-like isoform 1-T2 [Anomaloglossus baeobatrachus]|uniref:E3 ubiquitin/ISG15 ligase TRIM25-like n=1 Tax=Anomaloglossus baeobatrachus TaxID=238106 RepID=UPI003F4FEA19
MESGDFKDELNCSICLSLCTDPVSLRCGHFFCHYCIISALDAQEAAGVYSCPDCRAQYPERPAMEKKTKMENIVEKLSTQPEMEETRIFCTYCTKSPVLAVKSCLHCENSLCDDHLTAHNKTMDHILTEPTGSLGNKRCSLHKKVLEYYCPVDAACLCVSCCLVGEHQGHQVELLDVAAEKKKENLRKYLDELKEGKAEIQKRVQDLQNHKAKILEKASDKRMNISDIVMYMKKKLEMAEKKALSEVSRQEKKIMSQISHQIQNLKIQENKLSKKFHHMEEMCHVTDPIRLLQESHITECSHGGEEGTGGDGGEVSSEDNMDVANVLVSNTKVQDNDTGPITVLQKSDQRVDYNTSMASEDTSLVSDLHEMTDDMDMITNDLDEVLISLTLYRSMRDIVTNGTSKLGVYFGVYFPDILLDVDTVNKAVMISECLKMAEHSRILQERPKSSKRFVTFPQVLSRCGLSLGRHYWEVEWNQIGRCDIGMCYPSIKREGDKSVIGVDKKSWILILEGKEYSVMHNWSMNCFRLQLTCPTLGVFLDYEAGRLSFYELCDPIRHLHTFTASFTEPLHVVFNVDEGASVTIVN